ncbi:NAD(P)H-binding protein [Geodermatophilus sp. SYSU D01176]
MIIVSAATGRYGRLVVDRLLERVPATEVAVAVRNPARAADLAERGVEVRHGDYDRPETLRPAFEGADRLLYVSGPDLGGRIPQHRNVVAAALDAGVGGIAYTSGLGADVVEDGPLGEHHAGEQAVLRSGLPATVLRHPIYSDFFLGPDLAAAIETGELASSTRGRGMNTATRADLAEAAAVVLTDGDRFGRAYDFTGRLWTYPQLAAVLSELGGRPVVHRDVDEDAGVIGLLGIGPFIRASGFERQTGDLEAVLGRPATGLEDAVASALAARAPA